MGGRLEHEIRLLPQVLSCSFSKDDYVVVLIEPSGDPHTIQLAVERILQNAGSEATVRVIGPPEPVDAAATRVISPLVATATVATVAAIGVGALVGGLVATQHPAKPTPSPTRAAGGAAVVAAGSDIGAPFDSLDALRRVQVSAVATLTTIALPAEAPDHTLKILPTSRGSAAEAVSLTKAIPPLHPTSKVASDKTAGERHKGRGHNKAKGPPPWAHSGRPHDHRGKGLGRG
jgi:hypothetical protein